MANVGDRIRLSTGKGANREGVVVAVTGAMVRVRWASNEETSVVPAPGTLTVLRRGRAPKKVGTATKAPAATKAPSAKKSPAAKKAPVAKKAAATKKAPAVKKAAAVKKTPAAKKAVAKKATGTKRGSR